MQGYFLRLGERSGILSLMAQGRWPTDRLIEDVATLGRRGLPRRQYYAEVTARVRRVFDCEAACWHTLDPETRLITSDAPDELISAGVFTAATSPEAAAKLIASEYFIPDFNAFAELASRRVPVGILSETTKGRPERSTRWRELLEPSGIPFEMRAAFVSRGRAWGAVHLARRSDQRDFTRQDAAALARITSLIADGIRTSLRFDAAREPRGPSAPGLLILGPKNEIEMVTPPARELLAAMETRTSPGGEEPPGAVLALAGFVRGQTSSRGDAVAVPTSSGWVTLHASVPDGPGDRVAIVLERAVTTQSSAVRLEIDGVTRREREIAVLLAQGLSNPEIARTLVVSPYTVQDHIKSLFEKTGVSSRQELVARIFLDEYLPNVAGGEPLSSGGAFA